MVHPFRRHFQATLPFEKGLERNPASSAARCIVPPSNVLSAAKTDPVFAALTRQGKGALTVAGEDIPFHAFGSFHPVVKMIEAR